MSNETRFKRIIHLANLSTMTDRFFKYCNILMVLTSIHHAYGAYIYHTPWRLHVLALSIPVLALNFMAKKRHRNKVIFYSAYSVNLIASILLIGFYEGVYNHLIKDLLFYIGTNSEIMSNLFPAPKYVMPNDLFFELTGISQALVLIPIIFYFGKTGFLMLAYSCLPKDKTK